MTRSFRPWAVCLSQLAIAATLMTILSTGIAKATEPASLDESRDVAQTFLNERLWVWQQRLRLADWKISIKLVRTAALKPKTLGNIHWDADTRIAVIKVLDIADYKLSFPDTLKDMEFTVVHELVHLQLSSLPRNEASRSAEEKAVNTLTEALLTLDRHH